MTEITDKTGSLPPSIERFVLHWGEMGDKWGVNRSVAQIHALLFLSDRPLSAEEIAERLTIARSNVSNSLKELMGWQLVRRVQVLGDRRDYFEAEADMFEMVRRIVAGRKQRELDPAIDVLRACSAEAAADTRVSALARQRLASMLEFTETIDKGFGEIMRLPAPTVLKLIKMGGAIARFVGGSGRGGKPGK
ncbi:MAG: MarR family transcriptional regulator [Hyphomicrobium sp.]